MGIDDPDLAATSPLGRYLTAFLANGDRWFAWCLRTDDIEQTGAMIGAVPESMNRARPDGTTIGWRLAGLDTAMSDRSLPFFIQWDCSPDDHPSRTPVDHRIEARAVTGLEVVGDARRIGERLGGAVLPVSVVEGTEAGPRAVRVMTSQGSVVIT
jgi:hypothetical protein